MTDTNQKDLSDLWVPSQTTKEAENVRRQAMEAEGKKMTPGFRSARAEQGAHQDTHADPAPECTSLHAQRLAEARRAKQEEAVAAMEHADMTQFRTVVDTTSQTSRSLVGKPIPWPREAPAFELGQGGAFFGMDRLHPAQQVHMLSIGGSGSGKTASNVLPMMRAMLRYSLPTASGPKQTSMLIVDPKKELLDTVRQELSRAGELHRLHVLGVDDELPPVSFFDLDCSLSCREKLDRLNTLLGTEMLANGDQGYWQRAGLEVVLKFMELELAYRKATALNLVGHLPVASKMAAETNQNFWSSLIRVYRLSMSGGRRNFRKLTEGLESMLEPLGLKHHPDAQVMHAFLDPEDQMMQWVYRTQAAEPMLSLLGDKSISHIVDFDPFPTNEQTMLDLHELMDSGAVVVLQPEPRQASDLAARAIKAKWYEAVTSRTDMERPVGIVCDEFQRFITHDSVSGDANFLDTARAYRVNCVFATQSVGALEHALGSDAQARAAVTAILCNTPSKWFFASKDRATVDELRNLIPKSPSGGHVIDLRPPAQLQPGEAYWSLADGRWGRGRAQLNQLL